MMFRTRIRSRWLLIPYTGQVSPLLTMRPNSCITRVCGEIFEKMFLRASDESFVFRNGFSSSQETKSISSIKILPKDIQRALRHWDTAGLRLVVAARASVTRDWPSERLPLNCAKRAGPHSRPGVHRWARPLRLACTAFSPAARPNLLLRHPPLTPVTLPGHHCTAGTHTLLLRKPALFYTLQNNLSQCTEASGSS